MIKKDLFAASVEAASPGQKNATIDGSPIEECFKNFQGLELRSCRWVVNCPKAIVIAVHGIQTYSKFEYLRLQKDSANKKFELQDFPSNENLSFEDQYSETNSAPAPTCSLVYKGSWVELFNSKGISFCCLDLQGHGLSEGWRNSRCNVKCFDDFARDVIQYVHLVVESTFNFCSIENFHEILEYIAELPKIYLMGISMGGCICLRAIELMSESNDYIIRNIEETRKASAKHAASTHVGNLRLSILTGCICLAPMLSVEKIKRKRLSWFLLPFGAFLTKFLPDLPVASIEPNLLHPWIDDCKKKDKLVSFPSMIPACLSFECISAIKNTHEAADAIPRHIRLLLIHSKNDTLCEIEGTEFFFDRLATHPLKQFWKLQSMWHCLTQEERNEELAFSIIDWLFEKHSGNTHISKSNL